MNNYYTVSQVNNYIKSLVEKEAVLNRISIKGEISNCKYHSSGHIYFSIKDNGAALRCVMFARDAMSGLSFRLEDGQSVIVSGKVAFYERDGVVNMYVTEVSLDGIGALYERYELLKKQLLNEGLFDSKHKKPIPAHVKKLGIVTASTGAALRDILNVSKRRNPYVQPILYPAKVQGEGAAATVVKAIKALDSYGVDVIIVARGGGSIEDLWAFNEEIVARAVYECNTPIVSGVGHETDTTIIDYVSDFRAPTPSAAAEVCVYDYSLLESYLVDAHYDFVRAMTDKINRYREELEHYLKILEYNNPTEKLKSYRVFLDDTKDRMELVLKKLIDNFRSGLDNNGLRFKNLMDRRLQSSKHELAMLTERLAGASPLTKISGGYGYISQNGKNVTTVNQVNIGDNISVTLRDGYLDCVVADKANEGVQNGRK